MRAMKQRLRQALSKRQKRRIVDASLASSAVVVPIFYKDGECHVLFIKRTEWVKVHKGQISFPGGAYEPEDRTLFNTALRESAEEVGLTADVVEVLGELDDARTMTSNYVISPFVASIPWPYQFKLDRAEVEGLIEVPVSALLDGDCVRRETEIVNGVEVKAYYYHYNGKIVWGATARILNQFLDIFLNVMEDE
ncbi:NUDIX hydrolase [Chloroflexota bacterium]